MAARSTGRLPCVMWVGLTLIARVLASSLSLTIGRRGSQREQKQQKNLMGIVVLKIQTFTYQGNGSTGFVAQRTNKQPYCFEFWGACWLSDLQNLHYAFLVLCPGSIRPQLLLKENTPLKRTKILSRHGCLSVLTIGCSYLMLRATRKPQSELHMGLPEMRGQAANSILGLHSHSSPGMGRLSRSTDTNVPLD